VDTPRGPQEITVVGCGSSTGVDARPTCYDIVTIDPARMRCNVAFYQDEKGDGAGFELQNVAIDLSFSSYDASGSYDAPRKGLGSKSSVNDASQDGQSRIEELARILDERAENIILRINAVIDNIDKQAAQLTEKRIFGEHDHSIPPREGIPTEEIDAALKKSFEVSMKLRELRDKFSDLHAKHVKALRENMPILARELSNEALAILAEYNNIVPKAIGYSDKTGVDYDQGVEHVLISILDFPYYLRNSYCAA
jgi:hypothetical protein